MNFNPLTPGGAVYFEQAISTSHLRVPFIEEVSVLVEDSVPVFLENPEFKSLLPALPFERVGTYKGVRDNKVMWVHVGIYMAIEEFSDGI